MKKPKKPLRHGQVEITYDELAVPEFHFQKPAARPEPPQQPKGPVAYEELALPEIVPEEVEKERQLEDGQ